MKRIALIGGGALNLFLASLLSKEKNIQVDIIEIRDRVGKKILETGNGKCNFTNLNIMKNDYNNETFVENIINQDVITHFKNLGLLSYNDNEGRCYPCSDSANTILDLLRSSYINNDNFIELVNSNVEEITKKDNGYIINLNGKSFYYDYIVLGIGSKVNNKLYSPINLKLNMVKYSPTLCPLNINISGLKGVRVKCVANLYNSNELIYSEKGEVIFKDNAISGISIFNISFMLNKYKIDNPTLSLDLFSDISIDNLIEFLHKKINQDPSTFFIGITNKMIGQYIIKRLNIKNNITPKDIENIAYTLKNLTFKINGLVDAPQVASGGINLNEVNSNLELKKYPNIFIGGEMLDINGKCGGYNLHFAFSSALKIYQELKNRI